MKRVFAFAIALALMASACGKKEKSSSETGSASQGLEKIGVVECDVYLEKLTTCINGKVPEIVRLTIKTQLDKAVKDWKVAAATPEGKATLSTACKMATDAAKQMVAAYGCQM